VSAITATDARKGFFDLIKRVNERHEVMHIRHRQGDAVLMSETEYEGLMETLALLSDADFRRGLAAAEAQAAAGDTRSFEEVFDEPQ
jgi:antitoxin YefM